MRNQQRIELLYELIPQAFNGDNEDVAAVLVEDHESIPHLAHQLDQEGGGSSEGLVAAWNALVEKVTDEDMDYITENTDHPALYLADLI